MRTEARKPKPKRKDAGALLSLFFFPIKYSSTGWLRETKTTPPSTLAMWFTSHLYITENLPEWVNYFLPHIYFIAVYFLPFCSTESFLYLNTTDFLIDTSYGFFVVILLSCSGILSMLTTPSLKLSVISFSGASLDSLFCLLLPCLFPSFLFFFYFLKYVIPQVFFTILFFLHYPFS